MVLPGRLRNKDGTEKKYWRMRKEGVSLFSVIFFLSSSFFGEGEEQIRNGVVERGGKTKRGRENGVSSCYRGKDRKCER